MEKQLKCIMLIDDNPDDNFIHERVIKSNNFAQYVVAKETAAEAMDYLNFKSFEDYISPDLILLDINMPGMDGWQFLEKYQELDAELQGAVIVMLTSIQQNEEIAGRASEYKLTTSIKTKPLTRGMMEEILSEYFS